MLKKQILDQLEAAIEAVQRDLAGQVTELAARSTTVSLSAEEKTEYEHIVRLNNLLSLLQFEAEEYWAPRVAS